MVRITRLVVARGLANLPFETLPTRNKKQKAATKATKPRKIINERKAVPSKLSVEIPTTPINPSAEFPPVTTVVEIPAKPNKKWFEVTWSQTEKTTNKCTIKSPVKITIKSLTRSAVKDMIKTSIRSPAKDTIKTSTRSPAKDTEKTTRESSAEVPKKSSFSIPIVIHGQ